MSERPAILVNGRRSAGVPADDRGLHYGDGLFETIAVRDGRPQRWAQHMARLHEGCIRLGIPAPDPAACHDEALRLCAGRARAVLKLIVTRGRGARGYRPPAAAAATRIMLCGEWPRHAARADGAGARVRYCRLRLGRNPALAGLKHLNRLEYVLARAEWDDEFDEGLLCDDLGNVIEGTVSNLFAVRRGAIHTPDLSQCGVAGIVRQQVIEHAQRLAVPTRVAPLTQALVAHADELFLTNSLIGVWPVTRLEQQRYAIGPLTRRIAAALDDVQA